MRVALVPIGLLIGALLSRAAIVIARGDYGVDLAQPLAVVTYWQRAGALQWWCIACGIAIAACGYVLALRRSVSLAQTIVCSALGCAAAVSAAAIFSSDVYAYAGYGAMALHGIDPYAHARIALRTPLLDAVLWQWGNPPPVCVYGPAFVALAREIVALTQPLGAAATLWAFRALACAALVACAPLAYAAFASFPERTRRAAAVAIALNPVAIWSAAEGHNDALTLAIVLAGFALARARPFAGAFVVMLGALVKAPAALAAAGLAIAHWPQRARFVPLLGGALAGAIVVVAFAFPLLHGVHAHLAPAGRYDPQFSLQYALAQVVPLRAATIAVALAALALGVYGVRALLHGNRAGALAVAAALWIAVPNPYPWYGIWLLPIAMLSFDTPVSWALIAASLTVFARLYGDATTDLSRGANLAIVFCEFGVPLLIAFMPRWLARRREARAPRFQPASPV